jgi:hypothetical protein
MMIGSLAIAGYTSGIALAPWAVLAATLLFNMLRYRIALRYVRIPLPNFLAAQVILLAVWTALLARYAADLNVSLRSAITAAAVLLLAGYTFRHRPLPSLGTLS